MEDFLTFTDGLFAMLRKQADSGILNFILNKFFSFFFTFVFIFSSTLRIEAEDNEFYKNFLKENLKFPFVIDEEISGVANIIAEKLTKNSINIPLDKGKIESDVQSIFLSKGIVDMRFDAFALYIKKSHPVEEILKKFIGGIKPSYRGNLRVGYSFYSGDKTSVFVIIVVDRIIQLKKIPLTLKNPGKFLLEGFLIAQIKSIRVTVLTPDLQFIIPTTTINGANFSTLLPLDTKEGCYRIEIMGDIGNGPIILGMFDSFVGEGFNDYGCSWKKINEAEILSVEINKKHKNKAWSLFNSINFLREFFNLAPLKNEPILAKIALKHAENMKKEGFWGHVSPVDGNFGERLQKSNISPEIAGEVITISSSSENAFKNLLSSPEHLRTLLIPQFNKMGIATIMVEKNKFIFVAILAKY